MTDRTLQRMAAIVRPTTADEATRRVELIIATGADVGDGVRLSMRQLPDRPPVIPVLLDHKPSTETMAGRIVDLRLSGDQLIGVAELRDAPASEAAWPLVRSGIGVSVGASYRPSDLQLNPDGTETATRWTLREVSLVALAADLQAVTRSAPVPPASIPMTSSNVTITDDPQADPATIKRQRAAERLELTVRRAAAEAKLPAETVERIIAEHRDSGDQTAALTAVVREYRLESERRAPVYAGHPARGMDWPRTGREARPVSELEDTITRCLSGQAPGRPLVQVLRDCGFTGRSGGDVLRSAFAGGKPDSWLQRGFHSTSDAKDLFLGTGDRRLQERFAEPPRGILSLVRIRELSDFRPVSIIDVGLVGAADQLLEGAEIKFKTIADSAGTYKATRYGLGLSLSYEAAANDDLAGLDAVLQEASATMIESEANSLVQLLTADTDGADAPDGVALFDASHNNSIEAALTVTGLGAAVQALREQTSIGGRRLYLNPGTVMVGPELETQAAQLLAEQWAPNVPEEANPWRLNLVVEPSLEGVEWYLFSDGPRRFAELGRVAGMPRMMQEEDFTTSSLSIKVEHAYGCAIADHRVVVRCTEPQS